MKPVLVYRTLFRRRMILVGVVSVVLVISTVVVATNIFRGVKKTKATVVCDNATPKNCTISSQWLTIGSADKTYDGSNLTLDHAGLVISGTHSFASLTLDQGALTHPALVPGSDFSTSSPFTINASGLEKKIDLNITGALVLKNSSAIDAVGKGYPRRESPSSPATRSYGYSDGGGSTAVSSILAIGGGGSYGGAGGYVSPLWSSVGQSIVYGSAGDPVLPGSSGGTAFASIFGRDSVSFGGNGGGVVKIVANTLSLEDISSINASGSDANACRSGSVCGGAGSGGSINLKVGSIITVIGAVANGGVANGPYNCGSGACGAEGSVSIGGYTNNAPTVSNIIANGGMGGTGGGGGRIIVTTIPRPDYKISKWLETEDQQNQSGPANPYALQLGDAIRVKIKVENIEAGATVEDAILEKPIISQAIYCLPRDASINFSGTYDQTTRKIKWTYSGSVLSPTFEYICDVTKL